MVAKPEVEQTVELPVERERFVPPTTQLDNPADLTKIQRSGTATQADKNPAAIPLSSEQIIGVDKLKDLPPGQQQSPNATEVATMSLGEKRSKLGGGFIVEGSAASAIPAAIQQSESIIRKRLQSVATQGGERNDSSALPGVLDTVLSGIGSARVGTDTSSPSQIEQALGSNNSSSVQSLLSGTDSSAAARVKGVNIIEARRLAADKDYVVVRGTNINCVMDSRLISDVSGQTSCTLNTNVYSMNGAYRLIPKGSRLSGTYRGGTGDNDRLAVIWDRILTPGGIDVGISDPGTDVMGGTGVPGEFDGHWFKKLSTAVMVSLAGDIFKLGAVKYGPTISTTTVDTATGLKTEVKTPFESVTVDTLSTIPGQITAKTLATPGTVTVMQGQLINVTTTRDIDFRQVTNPL